MKKKVFFRVIGLIMSIAASEPVAKAGLISVAGGQITPPAALGSYAMTPFADDLRQVNLQCSYVASPLGGNVAFSFPMVHDEIMEGWLFWSNDYKGDIYWTGQGNYVNILSLPPDTCAFYFYAHPRSSSVHTISALANDGVNDICQISQDVQCQTGASYYGFYGTEGSIIETITIYCNTIDFAVGEFGISKLPAPEAFLLSNIGLTIVMGLRKLQML